LLKAMSMTIPLVPPQGASGRLSHAKLRELSRRRDGPAAIRMASHLGAIILVGSLAMAPTVLGSPLWVVSLVICQAFLVAFLFMPLHETVHKTAFRTRWPNVILGHLCGLAIGFPYEYYSVFHWEHHRHTQDPDKDPELLVMPGLTSATRLVVAFSGALQVASRLQLLLKHAITGSVTAPWVPADKHHLIVREARLYLLAYGVLIAGSVALQSSALLVVWIVPLLMGQFLLRPYLFTEHTGCGRTRSAFDNTRTTYTNAVIRWFAWNMPYHVEHHAYPSVPFHALPQLNAYVSAGIVHSERGYPRSISTALRSLRRAITTGPS
jgi:fatty acid desaturase